MKTYDTSYIDDAIIRSAVDSGRKDHILVREILAKAREMHGLSVQDVSTLMQITDRYLLEEMFNSARYVKETIYGKRLVLFAPLYISNFCDNECTYCAFRAKNRELVRKALNQREIYRETEQIVKSGHKRVLLVAGESYPKDKGFDYVLDAIDTVYSVKVGKSGEVRRINVNIAPLDVEDFRRLRESKIGTFQLFQETFDREVYKKVHVAGKKSDYDYRVTAFDRAMEAGISDVGTGVLFGLADWRYDVIALLLQAKHLEEKYGVGPHTVSVPRLEPATGSSVASNPPNAVSDFEFKKIVAILRLAVPYTGIIMSTRESEVMRSETFELGVSQISAGSRTSPGGYGEQERRQESQFFLGDQRSLDDVVHDIARLGYIPSFCTGCYRLGRVGEDFMDLAKPGLIHAHCNPNAVSTFVEYLEDYASERTQAVGYQAIEKMIDRMETKTAERSRKMMEEVKAGKRDVFC